MSGSDTRGIISGGLSPSLTNVIQYITIASTGNATDFGDLTVARTACGSNTNNVRSINSGGYISSNSNVIDYVTIAATGNAQDFGDLISAAEVYNTMSNGHGGLS